MMIDIKKFIDAGAGKIVMYLPNDRLEEDETVYGVPYGTISIELSPAEVFHLWKELGKQLLDEMGYNLCEQTMKLIRPQEEEDGLS